MTPTPDQLTDLIARVKRIEEKLGMASTLREQLVLPIRPAVFKVETHSHRSEGISAGKILGVVAAFCFIFAAVLFIKLSLDSGWLTPERQILLAGVSGVMFIALGILLEQEDRAYFSLLPAVGIVVLYLTVAGAQFLYELMPPETSILLMTAISVAGVMLLHKFQTSWYAALAVAGTYLSFMAYPAAENIPLTITYFLLWDVFFCYYGVHIGERAILGMGAYFSLMSLFVLLYQDTLAGTDNDILILCTIQSFQFVCFAFGYGRFAITNNKVMNFRETWMLFPVIVFFYGTQYYLFGKVSDTWANGFAIGLFAFVLVSYVYVVTHLENIRMESSAMIHLLLTFLFLHSVYGQFLTLRIQIWFGPIVMLAYLGILMKVHNRKDFWPITAGVVFVVAISYLAVLIGSQDLSRLENIVLNLIFFGLFAVLYGCMRTGNVLSSTLSEIGKTDQLGFISFVGSLQALVALYRVGFWVAGGLEIPNAAPFLVSLLWGMFGFGILLLGKFREDRLLERLSFGLLIFTAVKVFLGDVVDSPAWVRMTSFLVLGVILFTSGHVFRKTAMPKNVQ